MKNNEEEKDKFIISFLTQLQHHLRTFYTRNKIESCKKMRLKDMMDEKNGGGAGHDKLRKPLILFVTLPARTICDKIKRMDV